MQELTVRLEMVFEQVKKARKDAVSGRVIDVGSDHGYLAVRCLEALLNLPCVLRYIKVLLKDHRTRLLKQVLEIHPKFISLTVLRVFRLWLAIP